MSRHYDPWVEGKYKFIYKKQKVFIRRAATKWKKLNRKPEHFSMQGTWNFVPCMLLQCCLHLLGSNLSKYACPHADSKVWIQYLAGRGDSLPLPSLCFEKEFPSTELIHTMTSAKGKSQFKMWSLQYSAVRQGGGASSTLVSNMLLRRPEEICMVL